ncbi:hypothetical protein TpMuguga_02g02440 [Theileria parva strain Muguga]|uniref:uncharacterized protein n=1 Tax=Theileria parva strain Muguga TaxID=333668 RepID=UPI001C6173B0|nr:uncharacterized protein TpMuguga_02g02440 [Theileria parva strain Muguga]KAF5153696.1 hypothetical protein TpMuguga_02g02440 [Theileria parva strain Muguga]
MFNKIDFGIPREIGTLGFENTKQIMKWWIQQSIDPKMESMLFTHHKTIDFAQNVQFMPSNNL